MRVRVPRYLLGMASTPAATVIVNSRDRWTHAPETLELLVERTHARHRIVVEDGAAPPQVATAFDRIAAASDGRVRISRHDRYLGSNEARLAGMAYVDTDWVAFVENDCVLDEGWLDTLIAVAERHDAASAFPLYLERSADGPVVHGTGADLEVSGPPGRQRIRQHAPYMQRPLAEVAEIPGALVAGPRIQAEPHTVVIRRAVLDEMGGPDPELLGWFEHVDLALHHLRLGVESWFVPEVHCLYLPAERLERGEVSTFLLRWGRPWFDHSLARMCEAWGLDPDDEMWPKHGRYRTEVRRSVMTGDRRIDRVLDRAVLPVEWVLNRKWSDQRRRTPPERPVPSASRS